MNLNIIAITAASVLAIVTQSARADLVITEIMAKTTSGTTSTISDDWWELTNSGLAPINLQGYQWADTEDQLGGAAPAPNFFPSITINPGESIIILGENSIDESAWRTNWSLSPSVVVLSQDEMVDNVPPDGDIFSGLGSTSDGVFFYDSTGSLLDSFTYASQTQGSTLERDTLRNDLGVSIAGENGAITAANGDNGSPGLAIPEPSTAMLLLSAGALLIARRRLKAGR
jgi:hypothetical protein